MTAITTTKAFAQTAYGSVDVLSIHESVPLSELRDHDIIVKNYAAGANPIDFKARSGMDPNATIDPAKPVVVGWDGAGEVVYAGKAVTEFKAGDHVYYSGDITRQGSHAEYTVVDSRIAAPKPESLTFEQAATIPLVAITAWEALNEGAHAQPGEVLLVFNGAGGVGSFAIQLAKTMGLTVIATASRPETTEWCKKLGADHVINHKENITEQLEKLSLKPDIVFQLFDNVKLAELVKVAAPLGRVLLTWALDTETASSIDWLDAFMMRKTIVNELMFTRAFTLTGAEKQGQLLSSVGKLIDEGKIQHTLEKVLPFAETPNAHRLLEAHGVKGKIALAITDQSASK